MECARAKLEAWGGETDGDSELEVDEEPNLNAKDMDE